jgi:hypothetical protein
MYQNQLLKVENQVVEKDDKSLLRESLPQNHVLKNLLNDVSAYKKSPIQK